MKMHYGKTKRYGDYVPAIKYDGVWYALANYIGETEGTVRLAYYDEEKRQCGILIDGDYGEHHWMPVGVDDWGNVREFMDAFPNRSFWFETVFSEKRRMVNILSFGLIQRRKKTDSVQNRNEQGTCTASSMPPDGSAGSLGGTPNTPEADA